ncbi:hypothetical protein BX616_000939 [Lobosporangium transversale]|nr:hypothetical protein BX616_000939 [Lobosporangium transversale]
MDMQGSEKRKKMEALPLDIKWKLICQHEAQEQNKAKKRVEGQIDKSSPEYYVRKMQSDADLRNMDVKVLVALHVSLKSQPISWVRIFIQNRGQQILSSSLATLNHRPSRRDADLAMEHEIVKCLKTLLNNRWGAQEAIKHPPCIYALCFSITSPQIQTRKLVVEVLTFLCYCEVPMGHKLVLEGLDQVQEYWRESARFDAWMRILENTIDGRGRFGTAIGMSEELKKTGTLDSHLIEYVLSNVILINALLQVVDDIELRIHLRSQLTTSGLTRIISKMRSLNHDLIDRQLNIYEDEAENDYDDMVEFYNHQILHDMSDPYDVFHALLRSVESSRAYDFFLSLLQHMLLIREEGDLRIRYFQLMDAIVTQVVMDRRGLTDDLEQKIGYSVSQLVSKLVDQDRLNDILEESKQLKQEVENLKRQKIQLEHEIGQKDDGMLSQLKSNIYSLEDLLRVSRHTIQTLQTKLNNVEKETHAIMARQDAQIKHLTKSLEDANTLMAEAGLETGISIGTGPNRGSVRAGFREGVRGGVREGIREGVRESARENIRESGRESIREDFKEELKGAIAGGVGRGTGGKLGGVRESTGESAAGNGSTGTGGSGTGGSGTGGSGTGNARVQSTGSSSQVVDNERIRKLLEQTRAEGARLQKRYAKLPGLASTDQAAETTSTSRLEERSDALMNGSDRENLSDRLGAEGEQGGRDVSREKVDIGEELPEKNTESPPPASLPVEGQAPAPSSPLPTTQILSPLSPLPTSDDLPTSDSYPISDDFPASLQMPIWLQRTFQLQMLT